MTTCIIAAMRLSPEGLRKYTPNAHALVTGSAAMRLSPEGLRKIRSSA